LSGSLEQGVEGQRDGAPVTLQERQAPRKSGLTLACIPALNAEGTIAAVVLGCQKHVDLVVVCDDGSSDMTGEIASKLGAKVLKHEMNLGKGQAMRTLFEEAKRTGARAMVTIDSDGQHSPEEIPRLLRELESADVVIGSRFLEEGNAVPNHRKAVNMVLNAATSKTLSDTQSGYRAYNRRAIESIVPSEMGMGVDSEILIQAQRDGLRIAEVPVSVSYEGRSTSTHNPFFHTLDVIASIVKLTSIRHPLMFYGIPGLGLIVTGVYFTIITILRFARDQVITPLAISYGLVSLSLLLFGLITTFTGIILFTMTTVVRQKSRS
jgi:glycosyltransferase involved in cell wall biosynthesis